MNSLQKYKLIKVASAVNLQQLMSMTGGRRDLSPTEQARIEKEQQKLLPVIFKSDADDITADMASPILPALGYGSLGALGGGIIGNALNKDNKDATGALLGALLGGGIGGGIGYFKRKAENDTLAEYMRNLPEGSTTRGTLARDALYSRKEDQQQLNNIAKLNSGSNAALMAALLSR